MLHDCTYGPLLYNHSGASDRNIQVQYHSLLWTGSQRAEHKISKGTVAGPHHLSWDVVEHSADVSTVAAPLLYVQIRVLHTLSATCLWYSASFLSAVAQLRL